VSAVRILTLAALLAAIAALFVFGGEWTGQRPLGAGAGTAALLIVTGAVLLIVAGWFQQVQRPGESPRATPAAGSARSAFGPALDTAESVAVCAVDQNGRIVYWNAGAEKLFGRTARDVEGVALAGNLAVGDEDQAFLSEIDQTFRSGRSRGARRVTVQSDWGRPVDAVYALVPLLRYGKVVEVAILLVETRLGGSDDRYVRLLDGVPAGLLGVDAEGRVESANRRLAEWTGRRVEVLEGMDVERAVVLPESLRAEIRTLAQVRRRAGELPESIELDEILLTPDGDPRPVHVVARARPGGGADVLLVDSVSRQKLVAELAAARSALAGAREAAAETIESTTRELESSVERIVSAVRRARDERSGPLQRAQAEEMLAETTREFLKRLQAVRTAPGRADAASGQEKPLVLLVEDNEENRELLTHMLRSRGAEVVACGSGREALEAASRRRFSFVLLDLQMPEMDGHQVLQRLRSLPGGESIPVVALTALTSEGVRDRCEAEGMNDFVTKPVTLGRIRELVNRWGTPAV